MHPESMKFEATDDRYLSHLIDLSAMYGSRDVWPLVDRRPVYVGISHRPK